eukprot:3656455-Rhodomonas_salina.4
MRDRRALAILWLPLMHAFMHWHSRLIWKQSFGFIVAVVRVQQYSQWAGIGIPTAESRSGLAELPPEHTVTVTGRLSDK